VSLPTNSLNAEQVMGVIARINSTPEPSVARLRDILEMASQK